MGETQKEVLIKSMDEFTDAYVEAALCTSTDNRNESGGLPLDKNYTVDDIDINTLAKMIKDCKDFKKKCKRVYERGGWDDKHAGHDFWLTRNGHGTGFWDSGYKNPFVERIGKVLTKVSKAYGEFSLYIGDGQYDGVVLGYPVK